MGKADIELAKLWDSDNEKEDYEDSDFEEDDKPEVKIKKKSISTSKPHSVYKKHYRRRYSDILPRWKIAQLFGVSDKCVNSWLYRGRLPSRDLGDVIDFAIKYPVYRENINTKK